MFNKWWFILFLLVFHLNSFTQNNITDSLWQVWQDKTQADTIRLNAIAQISWDGYLYSQPDSAFYYAQLQYEFAKEKGLKKQMAGALNTQGISFSIRGNYANAIGYYTRSLKIRKKIGDKQGIAASLNNIGNIYLNQGDYAKAIDYYTHSLKVAEKIDDKQLMASNLNNVGVIYKNQGDYSKANNHYTRGLKIMEEIGDKRGIAISLNNIGNIYLAQGDYTKAIGYYIRSLKIRKKIGDKQGIAASLNNIGNIYLNQGDYIKAIDYYTYSLKVAEKIDDKRLMASNLNNIGIIYKNQGDSAYSIRNTTLSTKKYAKAIEYNMRALVCAQKMGVVLEIKDAANNLYETYKCMDNTKASLKMYELYITMRDSIENIETQREIIRQEFKYNYEKQALADSLTFVRQKELNTLTYQNEMEKERYSLLGGFVFLLILLGVYLRIRSIKRQNEKETLLQQIKLLKTEAIIEMKKGTSTDLTKYPQLNKKNIEAFINASLNQSDWSILNALYQTPVITNSEIAEEVSLSIEGVKSSLKKMYHLFDIPKSSKNKRISLVIEATKLSNNPQ